MSDDIDLLLSRSAKLESRLIEAMNIPLSQKTSREKLAITMCTISFEHAESLKMLIAARHFTSAVALLRVQYEAIARSIWLLYGAPQELVELLLSELNNSNAKRADKVPNLPDMLKQMEGKAPPGAIRMLQEFKEYSWKPLSSYIHGGIHAVNRRSNGYPVQIIIQALLASNGLSAMSASIARMLSTDPNLPARMASIQTEFADCLPPLNVQDKDPSTS